MKVKFKNKGYKLSVLALSALALASTSYGDYNSSNSNSHRMKNHDQRKGHNNHSVQCDKVITPAAGPRVTNGADLFISANFIYWKMSQNGSNFAYTGYQNNFARTLTLAADTPYTDVPQGQIYDVADDWAPGFKVGLGLDTSHDGWDIYAEYTWIRFTNNDAVSRDPIDNALPAAFSQVGAVQFPVVGTPLFDSVRADMRLTYNKINLEIGRNFYYSQYLTARPHAGLTGVWLRNRFNTKARNLDGVEIVTTNAAGTSVTLGLNGDDCTFAVNNNWGLGLRAGFDLGWYFTKEWSIYSNFIGNAIWNTYSTDSYIRGVRGTLTSTGQVAGLNVGDSFSQNITNINNTDSSVEGVNYVVEMELGLCWETFFYDDNYHFAAKIGWEMQDWINYMRVVRITGIEDNDLMLQGLNVKLRFDF